MAITVPRFTIRDLILLTCIWAVGCVALKYPTPVWSSVVSLAALLMFVGTLIIAVVDRCEPQSRAIGYLIGFSVYFLLLKWSPLPFGMPTPAAYLLSWMANVLSHSDISEINRFHAIGNALSAMTTGAAGNFFAGFVYRERIERELVRS